MIDGTVGFVSSVGQGAITGASVGGPVGAVVGGAIGAVSGMFGLSSSKKKKQAKKLMKEVSAIQRMQARRRALVEYQQAQAFVVAGGAASGFNPEGTSSMIAARQGVLAQVQSNLKTEAIIHGRAERAGKKMESAAKLAGIGQAIGSIGQAAIGAYFKNTGGLTAPPSSFNTSTDVSNLSIGSPFTPQDIIRHGR